MEVIHLLNQKAHDRAEHMQQLSRALQCSGLDNKDVPPLEPRNRRVPATNNCLQGDIGAEEDVSTVVVGQS